MNRKSKKKNQREVIKTLQPGEMQITQGPYDNITTDRR